jgi:hypothetical protein
LAGDANTVLAAIANKKMNERMPSENEEKINNARIESNDGE